ncbi:MAG: DNA translocase FtsK 4TM domain-containing protein [Desulfobacteraceae bacterium]|jgi:S-DNA-T family DNA segregation ATPase FtsK/SpoIIIE
MRKEILAICFLFIVVFTSISLLSYHDTDPSLIHNVGVKGNPHNLFGLLGAHVSGLLFGLFGLGAFWIPVLILLISIYLLNKLPARSAWSMVSAGGVLVVVTSTLLALKQSHYTFWGNTFFAGGIIGSPFKYYLVEYANHTGGFIILMVIWGISFIVATRFSFLAFLKRCHQVLYFMRAGISTLSGMAKGMLLNKLKKKAFGSRKIKGRDMKSDLEQPKVKIRSFASKINCDKDQSAIAESTEEQSDKKGFQLPLISFMDDPDINVEVADTQHLKILSQLLDEKLKDFGVKGNVTAILPGPVITTFEFKPAPGVKINKIINLSDDLALVLKAISVRIVAPIPGKSVIGIEIPNANRELVHLKEMILSDSFKKSTSKLTMCLGKDIVGNPVAAQLDKMPHLLIAGATGAGKSVALNTMISSLLYKSTPVDVRMIMIDPKRIELSLYDGIPHLITPVVTDAKKATNALFWAVKEMERRYELLSENKVRNIEQYNQKIEKELVSLKILENSDNDKNQTAFQPLPFIVIIIDELADLMMVASKDVEVALARLAQMARAAGIHIILATQRPSVDVLTGLIKANFPTRMTFKVSSKTDSRTIIDTNGAENLLGNGDMLFLPPGTSKLQRIHGAYISETELNRIVEFLKDQGTPDYDQSVLQNQEKGSSEQGEKEYDERYDDAVSLVTTTRQASISMIQRHFRIGYNRAARIVEVMEQEGIVGPSDGIKPREVLVRGYSDITP